MKHIQAYNRPEEESIAWWSLWFHWVYMVDSTATVNGLGEESLVKSDISIYLRERERFTQSTLGGVDS